MRLLLCSVLIAAAMPALAANYSGKWALASAGGRGGSTTLVLNQAGNEVTGTISVRIDTGTNSPVNQEVWGGKVEGATLSFYVWTGIDKPVKTTYTGKLSASGDEIDFTIASGTGSPRQAKAARAK